MFFQEIEGEAAVLIENGVYKQVPVFSRNGFLYAKVSGGFVRLYADGSTTRPKLRLDTISCENGALFKDKFGKLCTSTAPGARLLESEKARLLLGGPIEDQQAVESKRTL